jgi:RNA polymerase sigma-70 factor (ECF subfamily)
MPMPPENLEPELALLARLKRGDEAAFVALYRRHKDAVYRLALLYAGSAHAAADVTQEAFVFFMTKPGHYDPGRGTLAAWLCGVARNLARKQFAGREDATDPSELADDSAPLEEHIEYQTPLEKLLRDEAAEEVRQALARLAPHYRDVLILCELSELSYADAAQVCGIDIGTVRSRLSRGRAQLALRLAALGAGPAVKEAS